MKKNRGCCSICKFSFRLRKDGTIMQHHIYGNRFIDGKWCTYFKCEGSKKLSIMRVEEGL